MSNKERAYYLDLRVCVEFTGENMPDEDILLAPVKTFIKKHMKTYQKTSRLLQLKTNLYESGQNDTCSELEED